MEEFKIRLPASSKNLNVRTLAHRITAIEKFVKTTPNLATSLRCTDTSVKPAELGYSLVAVWQNKVAN